MSDFAATIIEVARAHEHLAYGLILLLAMSEALPVVGAFVPGTAMIVGVSALIPSGAVRLWPMIIATTIGAILGDGISYWLGHRYHRAITERWPLNRYPGLIARGDALFQRHGGKSVFIARFTPGVRAIVPLIAGILMMSPTRFYSMNVASAILWAPSHVLAGALIGASLALLGAVAGRLAVFVAVLVAVFWIMAWVTRYAIRRLPPLAARAQDRLWLWLSARDSWLSRQMLSLLDPTRKELPGLALLGAILIVGLWVFFGVLEDVISGDPLVRVDTAVFRLLQSLRTGWVYQLMVAVTELGDGTVTTAVTVVALLWLASRRAWRATIYVIAAVAAASMFTLLLKVTLSLPRPAEVSSGWDAFSFPSGHTTVNAAFYGFLAIVVAWEVAARWRPPVAIATAFLVLAIAVSRLYLGAHWISDVLGGLAFGVAWAALLAIAYLRRNPAPVRAGGLCTAVVLTVVVAGGIHIDRQHTADVTRYAVRENIRTIPLAAWWQQEWSDLPARRFDLGGELEEPLTFQWAGDLDNLQMALLVKGWRLPVPWGLQSSLAWFAPHVTLEQLPVLPRLQNGRLERLVMLHPLDNSDQPIRLVLHLWRSSVDLQHGGGHASPLWIGTVTMERMQSVMSLVTLTREQADMNTPRDTLAAAVPARRLVRRENVQPGAAWDGYVLLGR